VSVTLDDKREQHTTRHAWREVVCCAPLGCLAALQFLTVVPPFIRRPFTPTELGRAVAWFPLVGVLLGCTLAGLDWAVGLLFPLGVTASLILAAWALATGLLHLDGFLDTCDGLFGGATPEARLRIMRDERVGAFAVIGGVLLLLVKYSCLAALVGPAPALIVATTLGRFGIVVAIGAFPYARSEGLGRDMKDHTGWRQVVLATLTAVAVAVIAVPWLGLIAVAVALLATVGIGLFVIRRVPGLTGDVYGAICEVLETVTLLVFVSGERV
jgi:adenosylcobinamide-GDP ribazoletransferase